MTLSSVSVIGNALLGRGNIKGGGWGGGSGGKGQIDENKAAGKSEYNGKTYYFCATGDGIRRNHRPGEDPNEETRASIPPPADDLNLLRQARSHVPASMNHWSASR